ncbi:MAG: PQQ-binding-like beta-propeller repeat protein [Saprospiraceae bacterium]|nr:PQQ-binding-like beta-propeller repeat protein [Saprospiraceae bacterium]
MNKAATHFFLYFLFSSIFITSCSDKEKASPHADWSGYQGGNDRNQYSHLDQINTSNVTALKEAWRYDSGDADSTGKTQIQCNPLIIDGIIYGTNPALNIFALDGTTGKELWKFHPPISDDSGQGANRGLTVYGAGDQMCIIYTSGAFIYAVNAKTGKLVETFGDGGKVDLHKGLDRNVDSLFIVSNSPGVIYKDLFIVGSRVSESIGHVPGHIRAYDARTGEQKWIFHTIPHPGEEGYDTWPKDAYLKSGGANAWSGMSLDEKRGMVFVPTGSASFDFYGGDREGQNLFSNCVIALDANTGKKIWHYQTVHHDVWDRDNPAPPNLVTVTHNGKKIDAVAQITKSSYVFLFNRETGEPLFEVNEVPVPQSTLDGEKTWPTQPVPSKPRPFARHEITEKDLPIRSQEARQFAIDKLAQIQKGNQFQPPSEEGTLLFPGFDGGGEWGGAAADPEGIMYINSSEMPWIMTMNKVDKSQNQDMASMGKNVYKAACIACHGANLEGSNLYGNVPSLVNLKDRIDKPQLIKTLKNGKGVMPSFGTLSENALNALSAYLLQTEEKDNNKDVAATWPYPYTFGGYKRFVAPDGLAAINPPWGQLSAIDLNLGEIKWQVTLGNVDSIKIAGVAQTGTENYGGPIVTAGNLIFIAATTDSKIRAFDKSTGKELWSAKLPAPGFSTPATFSKNGKQFIVTAAGGGKIGQRSSGYYVAYAL